MFVFLLRQDHADEWGMPPLRRQEDRRPMIPLSKFLLPAHHPASIQAFDDLALELLEAGLTGTFRPPPRRQTTAQTTERLTAPGPAAVVALGSGPTRGRCQRSKSTETAREARHIEWSRPRRRATQYGGFSSQR